MAERKKPHTAAVLDASATVEPKDRKVRPSKASKPDENLKAAKPKTNQKVQSQMAKTARETEAANAREAERKVTVNEAALKGLCLRGPEDRRKELKDRVDETFERLGVRPKKAQPFAKGKGTDNFPNIHDLLRWMRSIDKNHKADIAFLERVRATLVESV